LWNCHETRYRDRQDVEVVKQGDPKAVSGGTTFDTAKINYAELPSRDSFDKIITFVDTSGGKSRTKGDSFVCATIGYRNNMNELWAINVFLDRMPAPEHQEKVIQIGNDM